MNGRLKSASCSAVVVTYGERGTPWLENLRRSNPGLEIHVACDERTGKSGDLWRGCDRFLRDWWKEHRSEVSGTHVWLLEHDVLVTTALPDCSGVRGMGGQHIKRAENRDWVWLHEADRLPEGMLPHGMAPLGVSVYHRDALEALVSPEWDSLFAADVFCELRLPSVIAHCGFPLLELPLPEVRSGTIPPKWGVPGIYHEVKGPVHSTERTKNQTIPQNNKTMIRIALSTDAKGHAPHATLIASILRRTALPVHVRCWCRGFSPESFESGRLKMEFILPFHGKPHGYLWLPIHFENGRILVNFPKTWKLSDFDKASDILFK